ncbi:cation transport ATPase [Paenibacillus shirakamiensis]|uniref:Cation transport ATPase n=1 Tax=Paenibacillus shirakamiensis TaxID=1265935 RepID=A0ABS4JET0_9BACL|nr:hypothetical protein [Paenibacillus shirakamiensis]MBP1999636.1 cation transport ATPase [Paenibacillus shirakamiensis]
MAATTEPQDQELGRAIVSILFTIIAFILSLFTLLIFSRNHNSPNTIGIWVPILITFLMSGAGVFFARQALQLDAGRKMGIFSMLVNSILIAFLIVLSILLLLK